MLRILSSDKRLASHLRGLKGASESMLEGVLEGIFELYFLGDINELI